MVESEIRDLLVDNLHIFDLNLSLIEKEHYIPEARATKSFIDILAKDDENNYVIIEIKRSNQAARQAIHEIYKYTEALMEKYRLKSGEIKSIIVSTDWKELYLPFSSFVNETKFTTLGFELVVNESTLRTNQVKPLKTNQGRVFSEKHSLCMYKDEKSLENGIKNHIEVYNKKTVSDFVLIILEASDCYREIIKNCYGEEFPIDKYIIYSAFQRFNEEEDYYKIIKKMDLEEYESVKSIIDDGYTDNLFLTLESSLIGNVKPYFKCDYYEIGYPAKFSEKILRKEEWIIKEIIRSESFKNNILLTDETIISEIKGDTGVKYGYLNASCKIEHTSKFNEIKKNVEHTLKFNNVWKNHCKNFLDEIEKKGIGDVNISIFSLNHILLSIIYIITAKSDEEVKENCPIYSIKYETEELIRYYIGVIHWNGKKLYLNDIVEKYYYGDVNNILTTMVWGGFDSRDEEIFEDLGFSYESYLVEIKGGTEKYYYYSNFKFKEVNEIRNDLFEFIKKNNSSLKVLYDLFKESYFTY